ncbi:MAG: hypothetical protein HY290_14760 [Planctomycetia bacterium]|nr:hypothetical protein [Planctomycetia bacterium]
MGNWPILLAAVVLLIVAAALVRKPLKAWRERHEADRARGDFRRQREVLEAKFFDLAAASGKPRGLRWVDCDWLESVTFARDRQSGLLTAFVAVNIRFEAIEGGDMEDVAAVGNIRDAAAVFHYQNGNWGTGGRALFNMNPDDALERLVAQFEPVPLAK